MQQNRRWKIVVTVLGLMGLTLLSIRARHESEGPRQAWVGSGHDPLTGAVLIDLDDDASDDEIARVASRVSAAISPVPWPVERALGDELEDDANLFRLRPPASELDDVLQALRGDEAVEEVERERTWRVPAAESDIRTSRAMSQRDAPDGFTPNDPYYAYQWHLDQIGMPEAWTRHRGNGVVVAVIDTGVAHRDEAPFSVAPDLAGTTFATGWDFVDNDPYPDDEHGHGTHVAGTIAQRTNNGVGVAGVAPEAHIMPLKVLDRNGSGGWGGIAAAIRYAADHGAHVINMSLGGGFPSRSVQRAIDYAHRNGVLVVAAAGNAGRGAVEYPARHRHVVAVGAVRYDRQLSFYSNWGRGLDLVAPGGDLRVDQNEDGMPDGVIQNTLVGGRADTFDYLAWQGTSMAAPHVAGVAALLYGSGIRDPDTVETLLGQSALDLGDAERYGSGLVQASHALRGAQLGTGAARGGVAVLLPLLLLLGLRRRDRLAVSPTTSIVWAVCLAGGLGVLPWAQLPIVGDELATATSLGVLGALSVALGPWGALLALSVVPVLAATAALYHLERCRPALVGLAFASAAFLAVEALLPTLRPALLPDWSVGPWLLLHAAACIGLGRLVARRA